MKKIILIVTILLVMPAFVFSYIAENDINLDEMADMLDYSNVIAEVKKISMDVDSARVKVNANYILNGNFFKDKSITAFEKKNTISNFWQAIAMYFESAQNFFYSNTNKDTFSPEIPYAAILYALEVQFEILDHYGNDRYKEYIKQVSQDIQEAICREEDIRFSGEAEFNYVDDYFGILPISDKEKHSQYFSVWMRASFRAIENTSIEDDKIYCNKINFIRNCLGE